MPNRHQQFMLDKWAALGTLVEGSVKVDSRGTVTCTVISRYLQPLFGFTERQQHWIITPNGSAFTARSKE